MKLELKRKLAIYFYFLFFWEFSRQQDINQNLDLESEYFNPRPKIQNPDLFSHSYHVGEKLSLTCLKKICEQSNYNSKSEPFILILISHPDNFYRRRIIRDTWGNEKDAELLRGCLMFSVGRYLSYPNKGKFDYINKLVDQEKAEFNDLLVLEINDTYQNLTLKVLNSMYVINSIVNPEQQKQCKFSLIKSDDDMTLNMRKISTYIKRTIRELKRNNNNTNAIAGYVYEGGQVFRGTKNMWGVPNSLYPFSHYPFSHYAAGNTYILFPDIIQPIINIAPFMPLIPIEDAHITGILRRGVEKSKGSEVQLLNEPRFDHWSVIPNAHIDEGLICDFKSGKRLTINGLFGDQLLKFWDTLTHIDCNEAL